MTSSAARGRDLLLALAACVLAAGGAATAALVPDALGPQVGEGGRVWLQGSAIVATLAVGVVGAGLLFGRRGTPGRQLVAGGVGAGGLALLAVVLGGIYVVVDDLVDAAEAAGLGLMVAIPAAGALWLGSGWLLRPR